MSVDAASMLVRLFFSNESPLLWERIVGASLISAFLLTSCAKTADKSQAIATEPQSLKNESSNHISAEKLDIEKFTEGLTPLSSPEAVIASVERGRNDPFAPPEEGSSFALGRESVNAVKQAVLSELSGNISGLEDSLVSLDSLQDGLFKFTGFLNSGQTTYLYISNGRKSGDVVFDGKNFVYDEDLIPVGWTLKSFDNKTGELGLSNNKFTIYIVPGNIAEQVSSIIEQIAKKIPPSQPQ